MLHVDDCTSNFGSMLLLHVRRWVAILGWGEGWHNNHHTFEYSARHGLEDWQVDVTWGVIKMLESLGLAHNIKLPSEKAKARLRLPKTN